MFIQQQNRSRNYETLVKLTTVWAGHWHWSSSCVTSISQAVLPGAPPVHKYRVIWLVWQERSLTSNVQTPTWTWLLPNHYWCECGIMWSCTLIPWQGKTSVIFKDIWTQLSGTTSSERALGRSLKIDGSMDGSRLSVRHCIASKCSTFYPGQIRWKFASCFQQNFADKYLSCQRFTFWLLYVSTHCAPPGWLLAFTVILSTHQDVAYSSRGRVMPLASIGKDIF